MSESHGPDYSPSPGRGGLSVPMPVHAGGRLVELAAILRSGRRFVAPADVAAELGIDPAPAAKKLSRWAAQGWLRRVRHGLYVLVPPDATEPARWSEDALIAADAVWSPCYFTGWTAASYWGLTDRESPTTVLKTSARVRASSVRLLDHDCLVAHVSPAAMEWGVGEEWHEDVPLRVADPARTVIDILDTPRLGGGIRNGAEILAAYLDDDRGATLIEHGDRLGNRAVFKRLGYMMEALGQGRGGLIEACRRRVSAGFSPLDPDGPTGGERVAAWGLRINMPLPSAEPWYPVSDSNR